MLCPSGPNVARPTAASIGMAVGSPPSTGTEYMFWIQVFHCFCLLR